MILLLLKIAITGIFLWVFHQYIINPLLLLWHYKKQGFKYINFFPFKGFTYFDDRDLAKYGDQLHQRRVLPKKDPDYKGIVTNYGRHAFIILSSPKLKKEFYVHKVNHWVKDREIIDNYARSMGIGSIVFHEFDKWKRSRAILGKSFNFDVLRSHMIDIAETVDEHYTETMRDGDFLKWNAIEHFQQITGTIIIRSFCGDELSKEKFMGESIANCIANIMADLGSQLYTIPFVLFGKKWFELGITAKDRLLNYKIVKFREFVLSFIHKKKKKFDEEWASGEFKNKTKKDYCEIFFEHNLTCKNKEDIFSDIEMVDELMQLFVAGTDSTGHWTTHVAYALSVNPEVYEKLNKEIDENIKTKEDLTFDKLNSLEYLNAVVKETLRMYPPTPEPFVREALDDHQLGDVFIKKGTRVRLEFLSPCMDPRNFENPDKFWPDRWIVNKSKIDNLDPYVYTPFSAGARTCLGMNMGTMEAKCIIAWFVKLFEFRLADPNYKMKWTVRFLYEPYETLFLRVEPKDYK